MQNHLNALMSLTNDVLLDCTVVVGGPEDTTRALRRPLGSDLDLFLVDAFEVGLF